MNAEVYTAIDALAKKIADDYRQRITAGNSVATGELERFSYVLEQNGSKYICYFILPTHWKYVEYGRRAGAKMPPVSAIRDWVVVKKLVPSGRQTIDGLSWAIAKGIANNGIPPRNYLASALSDADKDFEQTADKLAEILNSEIEAKLAKL